MMKMIALAAALVLTTQATAQTASSPAKKELVAKVLRAQQPAVEALARTLVEQPAVQLMQRAAQYMQARVPAEQREAMGREVQAEARKYVEETYPFVREQAIKLGPSTIGAVMEEQLTEAELRQILAVFESPAWRKFQSMGTEMQKALGEKLVAEVKDQVETRVRALDKAMGQTLGIAAPAASGASTGK